MIFVNPDHVPARRAAVRAGEARIHNETPARQFAAAGSIGGLLGREAFAELEIGKAARACLFKGSENLLLNYVEVRSNGIRCLDRCGQVISAVQLECVHEGSPVLDDPN